MSDVKTDAVVVDESEAEDPQRRNLALALFGALGGAALLEACVADGASPEGDLVGQVSQAASNTAIVGWADTVLGAAPPGARTGDLATKNSSAIGSAILVIAKCCVSAGDGGGGAFYWEAGITTGDDGGTIIVPQPSPAGRWRRVYSGPLNVRWFGAQGDGTTDDRPAIQKCIDCSFGKRTFKTWTGNNGFGAIAYTLPTVWLPSGLYCIGRESNTPGTDGYANGLILLPDLTLTGEGDASVLMPHSSVGNTHALVRSSNSNSHIRDLKFVDGYVHVALYGRSGSLTYGDVGNPAATPQAASSFVRCKFSAPRGIAVWHDTYPYDTSHFRSIQPQITFDRCVFESTPSVWWGTTDHLIFRGCVFQSDQANITAETTSDGLPLGIINNAAHTLLEQCIVAPAGAGAGNSWPARTCFYVGSGEFWMTDSVFFDRATVLYRERFPTYTSLISGNGSGAVAKALPYDAASRVALHATNTFFNCVGTNLLELYRSLPSCIRITGANGLNQDACYGIMIDNAVSAATGDLFNAFNHLWEIDEYHTAFRRIRQGDIDTLYNVQDGAGISDLTNRFEGFQVDQRDENEQYPTVCENLIPQGKVSLAPGGTVGVDFTGGSPFSLNYVGAETSTGYTIHQFASTANGQAWSWISPQLLSGMPAGVYYFSFELLGDYEGTLEFVVNLNGSGLRRAVRRIHRTGTNRYHRYGFSFYYPSGTTVLKIFCQGLSVPTGVTVSPGALFQLHRGSKWCGRYLAPTDSPTMPTTNTTSSRRVAVYYASAAPSSGNYIQGDIVYHSAPVANGNIGWVCVAGGSPGTWKSFGSIAP